MRPIVLWALVALIGRAECKCSLAPIVDDERSIAYVCTHGDLNDLGEISSEADWIEFTVSRFHVIPDYAFSRFSNLRRLSFYNCRVNFIAPNAFSGLDGLEWLIFHGTGMLVARTAWFLPLSNLRRLILDRCGLVHVEPDIFRMLPRLEVLGLRDNDLDCLPIEDFEYLRTLKTVRIDGNPWDCECRARLDEYLRSRSIVQEVECRRQVHVCRRYQCMTPIRFPVLPAVLTAQSTHDWERERAVIRGNEFQTNVFTSLDRLPDKTAWIEISGLTIDVLPRYGFFRFGNSLQTLDLIDCRIATIENEAFAGLNKLQRLSLVGNRFPVLGSAWFRNLVNLQQLILQRNQIEEIERTALWHVGGSLRHLDVRDNRLRCIAVGELAELKKLEKLDATGNPWLCACRRNLQEFLTQRNVGFEINAGGCYETESEIPGGTTGWGQQQTIVQNATLTSGKVHWTSFEDTLHQTNVSVIVRPPPSIPPPHRPTISVVTPQPPVYASTCYPEGTIDGYKTIYVCRAITSIEDVNAVPRNAHTIRVILSNIQTIPARSFVLFDGHLTRLELRDCGIRTIKSHAFAGLYNLEYLSLRDNQLETITVDMVQDLRNLRHLDLSHNSIHRISNDAFDRLPYLVHLDVSSNVMNCISVEYMAQRLRYLHSLNVADNPWSCLCARKLAEFLDDRRVQYDEKSLLWKEDCFAHPTPRPGVTIRPTVPTIPFTTTLTPISTETVTGNCTAREDRAGIRYQCAGGNLLLLQSIPPEVTAIEFYDGHLPLITSDCFSKFVNLRELIIRNSGLINIEQGAFNNLKRLENLTIQDNPLETIESSWFVFENLDRLDLRGNSIKFIEPGLFRYLKRLTYLNLEGNDLRCIFSSDLNEMPNVYVVQFSGNPLKWRCRVELEQFLEARKIRFTVIENSCEGKKLVRNLLLVNKTDGSFDCPSDCSTATSTIDRRFFVVFLLSLITLAY
ncbi:slit homolog 1 protein-like [Ceratina calcarata]|uniref:Slit homolog 1 protein-like n=1 Tax=Ceratina calcarata TaxID=156304 RepID=A0AAJ7J3M7_9HYME|nr:slit homolog 1 protein-like [Ceratina calcarata]